MTRLKTLGENIKKYRSLNNLSQEKLAEKVDLTREHIAAVETGKEYISLKRLFLIADVLNVPVKDLINFD